jgi:hypothetical protein
MAKDAMFFDEVVEDDAVAEFLEGVEIDRNGLGALSAVALGDFARDGLAIGDHPVDDAAGAVLANRFEVIGERVAGGFAGLRHEIGDVDTRGFRIGDGVSDFGNQQVGKDACVKRAGAEKNEIGFADGFDGSGKRAGVARREREALDALAAGGDAGFAVDATAVFESGDERNVGDCGRENLAADRENFAADADGFGEISRDVSEGGEEEVAEVVTDEAAAGVKAILKEATEEGFVLTESDHAVADVAGREDAIFAAQAAGAAAVVGDGNDGGEADNGVFGLDFVAAAGDEIFQAAQQSGKTGAAAEGDDVESIGGALWFGSGSFHDSVTMRFRTMVLHATLSVTSYDTASGAAMRIKSRSRNAG